MAVSGDGDAARIDVAEGARPTPAESDEGGRTLLALALGALVVAVLGAGAFFALSSGTHTTTAQRGDDLPVIRAEERPFKVSPDDPGGLEVPNRDKLVYSRLKGVADMPDVERLLPAPERPLPPPEQPAAAPPAQPAAAPPAQTAALNDPPPSDRHGEAAAPSPSAAAAGSPAVQGALDGGLPPVAAETSVPAATPAAPSLDAEPEAPVVALRPVARPAAKRPEATAGAKPAPALTLAKAEQKPAAVAKPAAETKLASLDTKPPAPQAAKTPAPQAEKPPAPQAEKPAAGGRFQVQLGAMSSPELARAQWAKLVASHGDILGRLQPSIARADLGDKGTFYRLRAGPIDGPQRAQQVCKALSGRSIGCVVISTSG